MFGLAEIKRMNEAAAVKEKFPEHDCRDSEDVANMIDEMYVDREDAREVQRERDQLAETIRKIVSDQQDRVNLDFDRWWAQDLLTIVEDNTQGYI